MLAWIGSLLLATCALPLAYEAIESKSTIHHNFLFLTMWTLGELFLLISYWREGPLVVNYLVNLTCLGIVWRYYK